MILVDLNQIVLSNMMKSVNSNGVIPESLLRHMILNAIRSFRNKFSGEYGDLILCSDSTQYWRKEIFPYYKANRKKAREESQIDWNAIHQILNKIKGEIEDNLPYKFIVVPRCEADDIIAVLCRNFSSEQKILIISGDKDFLQLQKFTNVNQYSPVLKVFMTEENPQQFLEEKIIYGDSGDGIPNILSDDDTFVTKKRQKRITAAYLARFSVLSADSEVQKNYIRNTRLIDFDCIPKHREHTILDSFFDPIKGSSDKAHKYLMKNGLKTLLMNGEF